MRCKLTHIDCDKNKNGWCMKYRKPLGGENGVTQNEWNDCFDNEIDKANLVVLSKKQHNEIHRPLLKYSTYELLYELLLRESEK